MELKVLQPEHMGRILTERNKLVNDGILRTPYLITPGMQDRWYREQIDNRESTTRYWALYATKTGSMSFVGYGGIEHIDWLNSHGEISLLIFENERGLGYGKAALEKFIDQARNHMGLMTVYAEVYECNPNLKFWEKQSWYSRDVLPRRKLWNGTLWDSIIFTWELE